MSTELMTERKGKLIGNSIGNRGVGGLKYFKDKGTGLKIKLNKLTFRQYMAFVLIYSKYVLEKKYPSMEAIKEAIGFKSDRMVDITLHSLAKKGLIEYTQNLEIKVKQELLDFSKEFIDPLILVHEFKTYDEIKQKLKICEVKKIESTKMQLNMSLWEHQDNKKIIASLNNDKKIFHRWYNYLEDFPPALIHQKLLEYKIKKGSLVLDPFVGSGTTLITSNLLGLNAIGVDVNPVATLVSKVKTNWNLDITLFKKEADKIITDFYAVLPYLKNIRLKSDFVDSMGFFEVHQWLKPKKQNEVSFMKERIAELQDSPLKDLFKLALIEAAVESSNVSFCPGTSFYPFRKRPDFIEAFIHKIQIMIEDLFIIQKVDSNFGKTIVYTDDSRNSSNFIKRNSVDFIITSPPYPNDLEYTRQTRLDMFLLGFVKNLADVQKIKRNMVKGSTKLIFKESDSAKFVEKFSSIQEVAKKIGSALDNKKWGWDYPRMIKEYFGDMYLAMKEFKIILKPNAYALLVVGDQTYKNIIIPVGKIFVEIAKDLGYSSTDIELFRVRRSTIHSISLNEEIVILKN